ncbi:cysteine and histidine-rich domain-containing protein 1-like [Ostrea edulis]|uniref:cysteine and histidine-rich domain-containing protein 1-like n=1 Tax=Ostrea edulis TaxID=37623 RepID=UPI0024AF366A|nr:cysteine and histidine-rich domain-containing protein 1-like [Ostrea edulis]
MTELVHCYNKGCGQKFDLANNKEDSCTFHPGQPVFHDALKGWSCCKKRSTDFTEFLNTPGCSKGCHTNVKPPEPVKEEKKLDNKDDVIEVKMPEPKKPRDPSARPPLDEPLAPLKVNIAPTLKQALEKHMDNLSLQTAEDKTDSKEVKVGTSCKNNGCKGCYQREESNSERCLYHPGYPVFHEGMKFWTCCNRKTSEFDLFLAQEGCETGQHLWIKPEVEGEKKSCRFDWHQTPSTVSLSVFAKVAVPEKCCITTNRVRCIIKIVFEGGNSLFEKDLILREEIIPEKSVVKMMGTKVEINLKKLESFSWPTLEFPVNPSENGKS